MSLRTILIASSMLLMPVGAAFAASEPDVSKPAADANAPVTRAELPALVREALMKNPEMLADAIKVLHDKQMKNAEQEAKDALSKHQKDLFNDTVSPSVGAKNADVTFVEFFDYHCGYCKHMLPTITQLIKEDKKVRVIFREFPILSKDSALAARAAIAVNRVAPAKYFDYHSALMDTNVEFTEEMLTDLAKSIGVDVAKFKKAFEDQETTDQLDKNRALADDLGIRGTPALVFHDKILPGALKYEELQKLVDGYHADKGKK